MLRAKAAYLVQKVAGQSAEITFTGQVGNIVLGSLSAVPIVGSVVEPLKEFEDCVETQIEQESEG